MDDDDHHHRQMAFREFRFFIFFLKKKENFQNPGKPLHPRYELYQFFFCLLDINNQLLCYRNNFDVSIKYQCVAVEQHSIIHDKLPKHSIQFNFRYDLRF